MEAASLSSGGGNRDTEGIYLVLSRDSVLPSVRLWLLGLSVGGCIRQSCFALSSLSPDSSIHKYFRMVGEKHCWKGRVLT